MEVLTFLAILFSPLIAVQATQWLNKSKEANARRIDVFGKLMATRAITTSPAHVEALNRIDIEFYSKKNKYKKVLDAWKIYHDHLCNYSKEVDENENDLKIWSNKNPELLTKLLYEMSQALGYDFDEVTIKRGHYFPRGLEDLHGDQFIIRKGLADIFSGKTLFPVLTIDKEQLEKQQAINEESKKLKSG